MDSCWAERMGSCCETGGMGASSKVKDGPGTVGRDKVKTGVICFWAGGMKLEGTLALTRCLARVGVPFLATSGAKGSSSSRSWLVMVLGGRSGLNCALNTVVSGGKVFLPVLIGGPRRDGLRPKEILLLTSVIIAFG